MHGILSTDVCTPMTIKNIFKENIDLLEISDIISISAIKYYPNS